jgi:hypothetical protein
MQLAGKLREGHDPHAHPARVARGGDRAEHPGVLLVAREELVAGTEIERMQHGVDAVRGGAGEGDGGLISPEQPGGALAQRVDPLELVLEPRLAAPAALELLVEGGLRGLERAPRHRPVRARVQVGDPPADRKLRSELLHAGRILGCGRP